MPKTLFIVNPNAGRVRKTWKELKPRLDEWVNDYTVVMTHFPEDVTECLAQSSVTDTEQIISVGGDGTNKFMINALMQHRREHPDHEVVFGSIPAGTGRDFARGVGLPLDTIQAAEYVLTQAEPKPIDIGLAKFAGEEHYFLNVSNVGIANDVAQRVERTSKRPWAFLWSVISALTRYQPERVQIDLDGEFWYEGNIYVVGIANGKSIGQGILIAPDAVVDDGYFDVVVAEQMPTLELMRVFPSIYSGTHITHPKVKVKRAKHVRITNPYGDNIGLDLDGEPSDGASIMTYDIMPKAIQMLL